MKLLYITNARIPTEKAHGLQIIKMCEAFQAQGTDIELIVPFRFQSDAMKKVHNLWTFYDVATTFPIRYLRSPDFLRWENMLPWKVMLSLYYLQSVIFSAMALFVTLFRSEVRYYSRDLATIFLLCVSKKLHRKEIYFEAHELHGEGAGQGVAARIFHYAMRWMLSRLSGLVVITEQLKGYYIGLGADERKILVASDGVDAKRLTAIPQKAEARRRLNISLDKKIVCYTGHLFKWKGVYTLAESASSLPEDYSIYIVGGMEEDLAPLQQFVAEAHLENVVLTGYVPYTNVPLYLSAADVLVLPNSAKAKISREYTSPLKLFEYMGAKRAIVASDLPSLREVLQHKRNAYLVEADDPKALAETVQYAVEHEDLSRQMTETAYTDVLTYTWQRRAENILHFIQVGDCKY